MRGDGFIAKKVAGMVVVFLFGRHPVSQRIMHVKFAALLTAALTKTPTSS